MQIQPLAPSAAPASKDVRDTRPEITSPPSFSRKLAASIASTAPLTPATEGKPAPDQMFRRVYQAITGAGNPASSQAADVFGPRSQLPNQLSEQVDLACLACEATGLKPGESMNVTVLGEPMVLRCPASNDGYFLQTANQAANAPLSGLFIGKDAYGHAVLKENMEPIVRGDPRLGPAMMKVGGLNAAFKMNMASGLFHRGFVG